MRISVVVLVAALAILSPLSAQDAPPRPVDTLLVEFIEDPEGSRALIMAGRCSDPGSWRRELVNRVLALPFEETRTNLIAATLSWTVMNCDIEEVDAWFRQQLVEVSDPRIARFLVQGLGRSGKLQNEVAARAAIFSPRFTDDQRTQMATDVIVDERDPHAAALELVALGYREHGTPPPPAFLVNSIGIADGDLGVAAKRKLLDAVLARPNDVGAFPMMNAIMSDAVRLDADDPWFGEVGRAVRAIASGEVVTSVELKEFAAARAARFGD